jgi:Na+/melibiose symporter-like transporter
VNRRFARLWVASLFAESAEWMLQIALPVFIYQATGSAGSTALTMAAGILPMVVLSPVAGVLADRLDRRRTLWCVCLAQAVVVVPLLVGAREMWLMYVIMAAQAGLSALFEPARSALVPALVPADRLTAANGLMGVNSSVSRLAGSSLGGLVLGFAGLGWVAGCYVTFLVLAAVLLLPRFMVQQRVVNGPVAWFGGFASFGRERSLRIALVTWTLCSLAQGMYLVLFVVFVTGSLHGGESDVGILRGVQAIGGLLAGWFVATVARRWSPMGLFGGGAVVLGVFALGVWNMPHVTMDMGLYVAAFAVVGAPGVAIAAGLLTTLQTMVPPDLVGRAMATVLAVAAGFQAVGMLTAGALVDAVHLDILLDAHAMILVVAGLFTLTASGPLRSARGSHLSTATP